MYNFEQHKAAIFRKYMGLVLARLSQKSKSQVLSFMFIPNCRRCPLPLKFITFVLNV
ncbi:hypothetical protein Hanom_Chr11g01021431 [Helianthus anomalus]